MKYARDNMQRYDPHMADSAHVEHEIDQCIIEAFT